MVVAKNVTTKLQVLDKAVHILHNANTVKERYGSKCFPSLVMSKIGGHTGLLNLGMVTYLVGKL